MKNITLLLVAALVFVAGCDQTDADAARKAAHRASQAASQASLPKDATNVIDKGSGWITFDLDGDTYLFKHSANYHNGYESITCITCCEENDQ